ncbi:MAG: hypothetical protein ACJ0FI_03035 [Gammaproteobacteria bacterium]
MNNWNFINKAVSTLAALLTILIIFGFILSSGVRGNVFNITDQLMNAGIIGILIVITWIWVFWNVPKTIIKLFKARGLNSKFWNSL